MSDGVMAACVSVIGMVSVAAISALIQFRITKSVIENDHKKIKHQASIDAYNQKRQHKNDHLLELLTEYLNLTDPEINGLYQYHVIVRLVHKIQLLLDTNNPIETELNSVLVDFTLHIRENVTGHRDREGFLNLHAAVCSVGQAVLKT